MRHLLAAALVACLALGAPVARAQAPSAADARAEARDRFDRGLRLFNEGDNAGALAEFRRAFDLSGNSVVLYNVGLVYAAMNRPVEATDALERVLSSPSGLSNEQLSRARAVRTDQAARVAELDLRTPVPGAVVEIDGVRAGVSPLSRPLRVASGTRLVSVIAPGHVPFRQEVTIAGGQRTSLEPDLPVLEQRLGHLELGSALPGADVLIDDKITGRTPLPGALAVVPGVHKILLRRAGYVGASADVRIEEGATARLELEPREDPSALASNAGTLSLTVSEPDPSIRVDGIARPGWRGGLHLPPGPHAVVIEHAGFFPLKRTIELRSGETTSVRLELEPTAEYRDKHGSRARAMRTWGWVGIATGAAILGGGIGFYAYNQGKLGDARSAYESYLTSRDPGGRCDSLSPDYYKVAGDCESLNDSLYDDYQKRRDHRVYGYVMMGAGAVIASTGAYLLLSGDDPNRYNQRPSARSNTLLPVAWYSGGPGFGFVGTF